MKKFLNSLYQITLIIGQARAAAALARHGQIEQAKALMLK